MPKALRDEQGKLIGAGTTSGGVDIVKLEGGGVAPRSQFTEPREGGPTISPTSRLPAFSNLDINLPPPGITTSGVFSTTEDLQRRAAEERKRLEQAQAVERSQRRAEITSQYEEAIGERVEAREAQAESYGGMFATKRRASTAALGFIEQQKEKVNKQIRQLEKDRDFALQNLDSALAERLEQRVQSFKDNEFRLLEFEQNAAIRQAQLMMQEAGITGFFEGRPTFERQREQRLQQQASSQLAKSEFDIVSKLPKGETFTASDGTVFTGIGSQEEADPFFTGSNLIALAKELPVGQTQELTDPNTGQVYTITGLQTDDPTIKTITTVNDRGEQTITSYRLTPDGGAEIINQVSAGKIGKTKAAPTTVILNQQQSGALGDAAAKLEASIGEDGFVNTDIYSQERQKFIQATGKPDLFDETFKSKLNPNDPSARRFLTKSEIEVATGEEGITPEQEEQLRGFGIDQTLIDAAKAAGLTMEDLIGG
jgi:hypothetical protein